MRMSAVATGFNLIELKVHFLIFAICGVVNLLQPLFCYSLWGFICILLFCVNLWGQ